MKYSPSYYANFLYETKDVTSLTNLLQKHWVVSWFPKILKEFEKLYYQREGIARVRVTSAYPLNQERQTAIRYLIGNIYKERRVLVNFITDATVIGGFRVESDEIIIPASLIDQVRRLQEQL